jgi:hypothetical protein
LGNANEDAIAAQSDAGGNHTASCIGVAKHATTTTTTMMVVVVVAARERWRHQLS